MSGEPILSFREVSLASTSPLVAALSAVTFEVQASEVMLIRAEVTTDSVPLFDVAEGLVAPDAGVVTFLGEAWAKAPEYDAARRRGMIGRVFEAQGWVSNLDVSENIVLAQRHHTLRPGQEILDEAEGLARRAGLGGIPPGRTHLLRKSDSRRAQWVRAFLGRPKLVLLEKPELDVSSGELPALVGLVNEAVGWGAAIVWSTMESSIWQNKQELGAARRFLFRDGQLLAATKEG